MCNNVLRLNSKSGSSLKDMGRMPLCSIYVVLLSLIWFWISFKTSIKAGGRSYRFLFACKKKYFLFTFSSLFLKAPFMRDKDWRTKECFSSRSLFNFDSQRKEQLANWTELHSELFSFIRYRLGFFTLLYLRWRHIFFPRKTWYKGPWGEGPITYEAVAASPCLAVYTYIAMRLTS